MRTSIFIIVAFLQFLCTCLLYCQNEEISFERLSVKQGLSQGSVLSMVQDKQGFMWFGTEDGLNRWDGYQFRVYRSKPGDNTSLPRNYIEALYEDSEGTLWIGTKGGLSRFNRSTETFTNYRADGKPQSLSNAYVTSIIGDADGIHLWVGTYGGGLCKMNKQTEQFKTYRKNSGDSDALQSDIVWRLAKDKDGAIWIGAYDVGLYCYNKQNDNFLRVVPEASWNLAWRGNDIQALCVDAQGTVWVGTNRNGLWRCEYDAATSTGNFTHFANNPANPASVGSSKVSAVLKSRSGALWVGTDYGLSVTGKSLEQFRTFRRDRGNPETLVNDEILSLYEDRNGTIWVGTRDGISFFNPKARKFLTYRSVDNQIRGLSNNAVWAFAEDRAGNIWIGTEDGLNRMESRPLAGGKGLFEVFRANAKLPNQLLENFISALCVSRDGTLWIGTYETGLYALRQTDVYGKGNFEHFDYEEADNSSLSSNSISSIIEDKNGKLWIGTDAGISRLDGLDASGKARFTRFDRTGSNNVQITTNNQRNILPSNLVFALHSGRDGTIWIGTERGLAKLNPISGEIQSFQSENTGDNAIQSIYEDKTGRIWLATEGGLNRFDTASEKIFALELQEEYNDSRFSELLRGTILSIQEDASGVLWFSTNEGLVRFAPNSGELRLFQESDGLQGDEFITGAAFKSRDGTMFFGGTNGFSVFHPDSLRSSSKSFPLIFTHLTRLGRNVPLDTAVSVLTSLVFPFNQNSFEMSFSALSFTQASGNRYRYKLEGFDTEWHSWDAQHEAHFTNLDIGKYRLLVEARNFEDALSTNSIEIEIVPPFYATWWFRFVVLAVIGFIAVIVLRNRKEQGSAISISTATLIVLLLSEVIGDFVIQPVMERFFPRNDGAEKLLSLLVKIVVIYFALVPLERRLQKFFSGNRPKQDLVEE